MIGAGGETYRGPIMYGIGEPTTHLSDVIFSHNRPQYTVAHRIILGHVVYVGIGDKEVLAKAVSAAAEGKRGELGHPEPLELPIISSYTTRKEDFYEGVPEFERVLPVDGGPRTEVPKITRAATSTVFQYMLVHQIGVEHGTPGPFPEVPSKSALPPPEFRLYPDA